MPKLTFALAMFVLALNSWTPLKARDLPDPYIIAHRGASAQAPENTLAAYRLAWEMGSHAAETDVWVTADGKVVCLHDRSLERTTGLDRLIDETTWEEVSQLDAGSWKGAKWAGEPIPLLANVLRSVPPGRQFFVEVKSTPDTVPAILDVIVESGKLDQIVLIAFNKRVLEVAEEILPDLPKYWLRGTERDEDGNHLPIPVDIVREALDAGFDGINVSFYGISDELVAECAANGTRLYIWTVNPLEDAIRFVEQGAFGITTDYPDIMLSHFHSE